MGALRDAWRTYENDQLIARFQALGLSTPAGSRLEAKQTAGTLASESVTFTQAFATVPIVTTSAQQPAGAGDDRIAQVRSVSTTGATVVSMNSAGTQTSTVKNVLAMEAT